MKTRPYKYSPELLQDLIHQGLTNAQIARELGTEQAAVNNRLNDIRRSELTSGIGLEVEGTVPIDLSLYDTVRGKDVRCRVMGISTDKILLKFLDEKYQTAEGQAGQYKEVSRADYASGKSGFTRVALDRVIVTKIKGRNESNVTTN